MHHIVRVLPCALALSLALAGQATPAATPPSAGDTPQSSGAPVSPLTQAATSSSAAAAPDKNGKTGNAAAAPRAFTTAANGESRTQDIIEIKLANDSVQITGAQQSSFLRKGQDSLAEFNYFTDHPFRGDTRVQVITMLRGTDDPHIDIEHNSVQRASLRFFNPRLDMTLGDSLVNFSRLSYNQSVRGLNLERRFDHGFKLAATGGVFTDRWGSLFRNLITKPYTRVVYGARAERTVGRGLLGVNFSDASDVRRSLPAEQAITPPIGNRVVSTDARWSLGRLNFLSEAAYSFSNPDKTLYHRTFGDYGGYLESNFHVGDLRLRGSLTRYQPLFLALNARQISDLQDAIFASTYDLGNNITVNGSLRRSNNDLRGQLPAEQVLSSPEIRLDFHDFHFLHRSSVEVGYRYRDLSSTRILPTASAANLAHRKVGIPFADLTLPVHTTLLSLHYEHRSTHDFINSDQTAGTDSIGGGFRGVYNFGKWTVNPLFRYDIERDFYSLFTNANNNRLVNGSLFIEAPKYFVFEGFYRRLSASTFQNFDNPLTPGALVLLGSGYLRPSYRAALSYKFRNDDNRVFHISYERNNNNFIDPVNPFAPPGPVTLRNFNERVFEVGLLYRISVY
ncbi:MAG: hypothetical protein ACYC6M_04335 [Terriglobales bacterium]